MARKKRWIATPEWQEAAREAIEREGRGVQSRIAKQVKCSRAAVTKLIHGPPSASHLIGPLSKALGIFEPTPAPDNDTANLMAKLQGLSSDELRAVETMVDHLLHGKPSLH